LSQARQCGDDVFLIFVTGYPPARGGGGVPQRNILSSRSSRFITRKSAMMAAWLVVIE